jgi:NADP-dependent 3-hydroxy acid dehydrogenase YdfG
MTALDQQVALVTGGSSGIGFAAAQRLVAANARVLVVSREGPRLRAAAQALGARAQALATDLSNPSEIAQLMATVKERYGQLDTLVINAGVSHAPDISELDLASYRALMDVNCMGATFTFVHALPLLADGASVVFVGSVAGRKGQPGDALYAGSKGFIRAFARTAGTDPRSWRGAFA